MRKEYQVFWKYGFNTFGYYNLKDLTRLKNSGMILHFR